MPRGRPIKTDIRERIAAILQHMNIAYGYQIFKIYRDIFGYISLRNLYYNVKKGMELGEFVVVDVKRENGLFTWGQNVEHKYYTLGPFAIFPKKLKEGEIKKLNSLNREEIKIDWEDIIKKQIIKLENEIREFNKSKSRFKYEDKIKIEHSIKRKIVVLKDWLKAKVGKNQILKAKINNLNELINTQTP